MSVSSADQAEAVTTVREFLRFLDLRDLQRAREAFEVVAELVDDQSALLGTTRRRLDDLEEELTAALELAREGLAGFVDPDRA